MDTKFNLLMKPYFHETSTNMKFNILAESYKKQNKKKSKIIWQDVQYNTMYQMQEVVKCYLVFIFTCFFWTLSLRSKTIAKKLCFSSRCKDLMRACPWSKKYLINGWEIFILYWEESEWGEALVKNLWFAPANGWGICGGGSSATLRNFYPHLSL